MTTRKKKNIRAVLMIDLSGTLYIGDEAIPGAREVLRKLRVAAIPERGNGHDVPAIRFLTNTSTKSVLNSWISSTRFQLSVSLYHPRR